MSDRSLPGIQNEPAKTPRWAWLALIGGAIVLVAIFVGVASSLGHSFSAPAPGADKYTQTWSKNYSSTTCAEWNDKMSTQQQFAAAADMLTGARNKGDGGTGLPPDSLINEFESGVTTACVVDSMSLAEVGAVLYMTEPRFAP